MSTAHLPTSANEGVRTHGLTADSGHAAAEKQMAPSPLASEITDGTTMSRTKNAPRIAATRWGFAIAIESLSILSPRATPRRRDASPARLPGLRPPDLRGQEPRHRRGPGREDVPGHDVQVRQAGQGALLQRRRDVLDRVPGWAREGKAGVGAQFPLTPRSSPRSSRALQGAPTCPDHHDRIRDDEEESSLEG